MEWQLNKMRTSVAQFVNYCLHLIAGISKKLVPRSWFLSRVPRMNFGKLAAFEAGYSTIQKFV